MVYKWPWDDDDDGIEYDENDDDDEVKLGVDYRNVEFLITTGPGPCPQLDNRNIVFGTVLEGTYSSITCHNYLS